MRAIVSVFTSNNVEAVIKERTAASEPLQGKNKYLPQVDIVRGVAVIAVMAFHLWPSSAENGYLGVDVFFVISGFVIARTNLSGDTLRLKINRYSWLEFIKKRIYRLLPGLIVYAIIISVASSLFEPDLSASSSAIRYTVLGLSNIYFARQQGNYFGGEFDFNPFLQTWSLGIEIQFYVLVSVALCMCGLVRGKERKKGVVIGFATALIASILIYISKAATDSAPVYYFLPQARFWELIIGMFSYWVTESEAAGKRLRTWNMKIAMYAIAFLICLPLLEVDYAERIIICFATALLLIDIQLKPDNRLLGNNKVMIEIGKASYSIYLWHWGLIVLSRLTVGLTDIMSVAIFVAAIGIGILITEKVEIPIRSHLAKSSKKAQLAGCGTLVMLNIVPAMLVNKEFYWGESPTIRQIQTKDIDSIPGTTIGIANCFDFTNTKEAFRECSTDRKDRKTRLWVLGDSHAFSLIHAASGLARRKNMNLTLLSNGGTPFPSASIGIRSDTGAEKKRNNVIQLEGLVRSEIGKGDVVLIANRLPYYFGGESYENNDSVFRFYTEQSSRGEALQEWLKNVKEIGREIERKGGRVIVMGLTPEWEKAKRRECLGQSQEWFNRMRGVNCTQEVEVVNEEYRSLLNRLEKLEKESNIAFYYPVKDICGTHECSFSVLLGGRRVALYYDDDHISSYAAREYVLPGLLRMLDRYNVEDTKGR